MSESGERPKIVINASGTEKEVPPKEEATSGAKASEEKPKAKAGSGSKKEKSAAEDFGTGFAAGVVGGEVAETIINEGAKLLREKLYGKGERGRGKKDRGEDKFGELTFSEVIRRLEDPKTPDDDRRYLEAVKEKAIKDVEDLDGGEFLEGVRDLIRESLPHYEWGGEKNVFNYLTTLAANLDDQLERSGGRKSWKGLVPYAMGSEVAKLRLLGITQKESGKVDEDWRKSHGYDEKRITSLEEFSEKTHIYDLLPQNAETVVGSKGEEYSFVGEGEKTDTAGEGSGFPMTADQWREIMGQSSREEIKSLYRKAEKGMYAIPSGLEVPRFLIGASEKEKDEWGARAKIASACFGKRSVKGPDELSQNVEAQAITNEELELLLNKPGVLEAISLETGLLVRKKSPWQLINQAERVAKPRNLGLLSNCPNFLNEIKEGKHLEGFREAKIFWLTTFRGLNREQAEDAEAISRNLIYLANLQEDYDTRYEGETMVRGQEYKFTSPTVPLFKSLSAWQLIHLQERLQAKTESSKEAWSIFGAYALNKRFRHPNWSVSSERLLPIRLVVNAFDYNKDGKGRRFTQIFLENFDRLQSNPRIDSKRLDHPNFGGDIAEGPFAGYSFLALSPAATVFNVVTNPGKFDNNWNNLGNALRSCEVSAFYRDRIILGLYGVDARSDKLKPAGGLSGKDGFDGYVSQIKTSAPTFWS